MAISKKPEPKHFKSCTHFNLQMYKLIRQRKSTRGTIEQGYLPSITLGSDTLTYLELHEVGL